MPELHDALDAQLRRAAQETARVLLDRYEAHLSTLFTDEADAAEWSRRLPLKTATSQGDALKGPELRIELSCPIHGAVLWGPVLTREDLERAVTDRSALLCPACKPDGASHRPLKAS